MHLSGYPATLLDMSFPTFLVGGAVRDELLGRECNDLDFVVEAPSFDAMAMDVVNRGGVVKQVNADLGSCGLSASA